MDSAKDKDPTALRRERVDDGFDLSQRFAGMKLRLDVIFALQQFQVGDRFKAHNLVAAGRVDHQVARDREQIGPARRNIFPIFRGEGPGHDLGDHVVQFMSGRQNPSEAGAERSFLWQDDRFEPFQFGANSMHVDPLDVSRASPAFFYLS